MKSFPPHSKKLSSTPEVRLCPKQDHAADLRDCPCSDTHHSSPPRQHHGSPGPTEGEDGTDFGQLTGCVSQLENVCHPTGLAMAQNCWLRGAYKTWGSRPREAIQMMMVSTEALSFSFSPFLEGLPRRLQSKIHTHENSVDYTIQNLQAACSSLGH